MGEVVDMQGPELRDSRVAVLGLSSLRITIRFEEARGAISQALQKTIATGLNQVRNFPSSKVPNSKRGWTPAIF